MVRTKTERRRSEYLAKRRVRDQYSYNPDAIQTARQVGCLASVHGTNKKLVRDKTSEACENVVRRRNLKASS